MTRQWEEKKDMRRGRVNSIWGELGRREGEIKTDWAKFYVDRCSVSTQCGHVFFADDSISMIRIKNVSTVGK